MKAFIILFSIAVTLVSAPATNTAVPPAKAAPAVPAATNAKPAVSDESKADEALANYKRILLYGTPAQTREALERIKKTKTDREIALVVEHYPAERKRQVKMAILEFFKTVIDARAKPVILAALADEDEAVSKNAYSMLVFYPEKEFEPFMIKGLASRDVLSLEGCIKALAEIKSQAAATNLIALYTNESTKESTRSEILAAFGKIVYPEAEKHIRAAARDAGESPYVRYQAVVALGAYPTKENWALLKEILAEDTAELTARVIHVLPSFGAFTDAKREIFDAAKSDAEKVRVTALRALSKYKGEDTKKMLLFRLATESSVDAVLAALDSLAEYDDGDGPTSESARSAIRELYKNTRAGKVKTRAKEILDKKGIVVDDKK